MDFSIQRIELPEEKLIETIELLYGSSEGDPTSTDVYTDIMNAIEEGEAFGFVAELDEESKMYVQCAPSGDGMWLVEINEHNFNKN